MGNATSAGLGSEAPHDQRDIKFARGHNLDTRPDDIELAEEAKGSEVINSSNLDNEVLKLPAYESYSGAFKRGTAIRLEVPTKSYISAKSGAKVSPRPPASYELYTATTITTTTTTTA